MTVSPAPRPRSAFLGVLDGVFLVLGIVFLASLAVTQWSRPDLPGEIWILRVDLGGSLLLLAWSLFRLSQGRWANRGRTFGKHAVSLALALLVLVGWPIVLTLEVRQASRAQATTELCVVVRRVDRIGPLALAARPARAQALDALRQQVDRAQDGQALDKVLRGALRVSYFPHEERFAARQLAEVVLGVLRVGATDPDLDALKHDAANRLAPLARASADHFLLASLASEVRQHGWENDPDCALLLSIWHQRTDHGPF